jgi:hypothetical protein
MILLQPPGKNDNRSAMSARSSSGRLAHARSFELFQPRRGWGIAYEPRHPAALVDKQIEGVLSW